MTEDEARARISANYGKAATARVAAFLAMVIAENRCQNLIAPSTIDLIWSRHAMDSAQLIPLARDGLWLDIGTGGGFPGLLIALLWGEPMVLIEPRRKRAEFLAACIQKLGLPHASVAACGVASFSGVAATISARALGPVEKLLQMAAHCAKSDTRWLLPRGRFAEAELVELQSRWRGVFHVEHSITEASSSILVIDGVRGR